MSTHLVLNPSYARWGCTEFSKGMPKWPQPEPLSGLGFISLQVLLKLGAFDGFPSQNGRSFSSLRHQRLRVVYM